MGTAGRRVAWRGTNSHSRATQPVGISQLGGAVFYRPGHVVGVGADDLLEVGAVAQRRPERIEANLGRVYLAGYREKMGKRVDRLTEFAQHHVDLRHVPEPEGSCEYVDNDGQQALALRTGF